MHLHAKMMLQTVSLVSTHLLTLCFHHFYVKVG